MNFLSCKYVDVVPGRYGNEYTESYRCAATNRECAGYYCELTEQEADCLFADIQKKIRL